MQALVRKSGRCVRRGVRTLAERTGTEESPLRRLLGDASEFTEGAQQESELRWATQPYTTRPGRARPPPAVQPADTTVLLFPGQGAHFVGMGAALRDVPAARDLYELASSILGWDVWRVCTEGPADELSTRCQVATLVTSLAALEAARERRPSAVQRARAAAGFSLGELSALVLAAALPFEQALRLVEVRAAAMRAAARARPGGMLTVWLAADARLAEVLARARDHAAQAGVDAPVCEVANYLYANCKVIAGDHEALRWVERSGGALGVRRSARVRVEGAYHTALMRAAEEPVRAAVRLCTLRAPALRVYCGAEARPFGDARDVARGVVRALAAPVRWEQTLHALYARPREAGMPLTLALGPGGAVRAALRHVNARAYDASEQVDV